MGDNPVTRTDPGGHCWPLCTMLIGAVIGAAVNVGMTVIGNAIAGKPTTPGEVLQSAVVGAVSGAVSGLVGPEAGPVAKVAVGALANGVGQMAGNALSGKPLMDGVGEAVVSGAITGGVMEGAGSLLEGMGGKVLSSLAEDCGLSFAANTQVATPHGKQAIGTLKPGETVQSYDPVTKKVSTQTVQRVFINHDTDLLDVTVQVNTSSAATAQSKYAHVAVKSHGSHAPPQESVTEVVHTTQKHPWLTTTGWRIAGQLHIGDRVVRLDGTTATVIALRVVPSTAAMYDLTVSNIHTFAVGDGQYVVHNCGDSNIAYRVLAYGEDTSNVIAAKDPNSTATIFDHVKYGSKEWYPGDQFISITKSKAFAQSWAIGENKLVALIDTSKITSPIIDLSTEEAQRAVGFWGSQASRKSLLAEEMLVQQWINPEAILGYVRGSGL